MAEIKSKHMMVLTPSNQETLEEIINRMDKDLGATLNLENLPTEARVSLQKLNIDLFKLGRLFCGWED